MTSYEPFLGTSSPAILGGYVSPTIRLSTTGTWAGSWGAEAIRMPPQPQPKAKASPATELIWKTLKESECDTLSRWEDIVRNGASEGRTIKDVAELLKQDFAKEIGGVGWDTLSSFLLNGMFECCEFEVIAWRLRDDWGGKPMHMLPEWQGTEEQLLTSMYPDLTKAVGSEDAKRLKEKIWGEFMVVSKNDDSDLSISRTLTHGVMSSKEALEWIELIDKTAQVRRKTYERDTGTIRIYVEETDPRNHRTETKCIEIYDTSITDLGDVDLSVPP